MSQVKLAFLTVWAKQNEMIHTWYYLVTGTLNNHV